MVLVLNLKVLVLVLVLLLDKQVLNASLELTNRTIVAYTAPARVTSSNHQMILQHARNVISTTFSS